MIHGLCQKQARCGLPLCRKSSSRCSQCQLPCESVFPKYAYLHVAPRTSSMRSSIACVTCYVHAAHDHEAASCTGANHNIIAKLVCSTKLCVHDCYSATLKGASLRVQLFNPRGTAAAGAQSRSTHADRTSVDMPCPACACSIIFRLKYHFEMIDSVDGTVACTRHKGVVPACLVPRKRESALSCCTTLKTKEMKSTLQM